MLVDTCYVRFCAVSTCIGVCVCVLVLAEAIGVGQKYNGSAAKRSGMRKVENLDFA